MKESYKNVAVVVIKLNNGHGAVRLFINEEIITDNYKTDPLTRDAAIMILLKSGYFCWLIDNV